MSPELQKGDALLLVDIQNDFCPGGALAVPQGDAILPVANHWIRKAVAARVPVFASRDWHPANHVSFRERGGPWPPHCIRETEGARFHPDLDLPADAVIVSKATEPDTDSYSAFGGTGLDETLRAMGIGRLWVCGLALDYCVAETVLDARRYGFDIQLIVGGMRPVEVQTGDGARALDRMCAAGARTAAST